LWSYQERPNSVWSLEFSPDGDRLAVGSLNGTLRLLDVTSGKEIGKPLTGHIDAIQDIAFQPHGNLVATAGWDNTIRLWDMDKHAQAAAPLTEHTNRPVVLSFSPDGTRMASAGWDGTPLVWDVRNHTVLAALREPGNVQGIRFTGTQDLVGTGPNGLVATWDLDPQAALGDVCERLSPQLTPDEWRQFAPDVDYVEQCG
jgi:WD40 repeat protein